MNTITNLGNLSALTVTGNITTTDLAVINSTSVGGNLTVTGGLYVPGTITGGTFSGTLSSTAQNTIISLGNLQALTVNGNITSTNLAVTSGASVGGNLTVTGGLYVPGTITGGTFSGTLNAASSAAAQTIQGIVDLGIASAYTIDDNSQGVYDGLITTSVVAADGLTITIIDATISNKGRVIYISALAAGSFDVLHSAGSNILGPGTVTGDLGNRKSCILISNGTNWIVVSSQ
jgi:cytoskeletal protein CcmA (bactofilin family)